MNRALIGPIVSVLYLVCQHFLGLDVSEDQLTVTVNTVIVIISGIWAIIGVFTHPKKPIE